MAAFDECVLQGRRCRPVVLGAPRKGIGRGNDTFGNPHRAQISQFELFELVLLLKLDKQLPVEQLEQTVSQSTVPSPPVSVGKAVTPRRLGVAPRMIPGSPSSRAPSNTLHTLPSEAPLVRKHIPCAGYTIISTTYVSDIHYR